ncbi:DUF397 domain-containing protein [Streptomyces luteireticuli]|uniref:DUF397 domain-containing protein n=1 Tax=Streptomyces luteireticuli TaxID=173858 RepID=UPI00355809BF
MRTVTLDLSIAAWRKSSYSQNSGGCVEIAERFPGVVPIRDSKSPAHAPIIVSRRAWAAFVNMLRTDPSA